MRIFKLVVLILTIHSFPCTAQNFHKFRFGLGIGMTERSTISIMFFEPSFRLNDNVVIAWRIDAMGERGVRDCFSLTLNTQYYLHKKTAATKDFRAFVGLGAGVFFPLRSNPHIPISLTNGQLVDGYLVGETSEARPGFYPRIGVEYRHFSVMVEYNIIYRKHLSYTCFDPRNNQYLPPNSSFYRSDSYLAFKIGYYIGGGRKRKSAK